MIKYHLHDKKEKHHLINSFSQIAWLDPFPEDAESLKSSFVEPAKIDDLVYHKSRLKPGFIPWVVYIPRKDIMFKIMRGCIGVTDKS